MSFKLSLIQLVYASDAAGPDLDTKLLQKANAWLHRQVAGISDALLLIGVGFGDEPSFLAMLKSYGLANATVRVITPEELSENHGDILGELVEPIAEKWIAEHHQRAIPIIDWRILVPGASYSLDDWWWVGLESKDDQQSTLYWVVDQLLPHAYRPQALTWTTLITECCGLEPDDEESSGYEAAMTALTMARWLTGFDAATENNFYDFSTSDAIEAGGVDPLRLGFEAGRNHENELGDYFDGNDSPDESLAATCLIACLEERNAGVRDAIADALGGDASLFWSLHSTIWPDLQKPMSEAMDDLLNHRNSDEGELDRAWRFVTDGWIDFAEE